MIADSNNFFFECDRSNSNAKIPHATVGRAAPATNRRRQSFTASLTCATRAGSSLLTAAVINTAHKTRPKAFKNIRALINRCPTGEHPFITRDWLFQPSLPCADQQDQRADPFRMNRSNTACKARSRSSRAPGLRRTSAAAWLPILPSISMPASRGNHQIDSRAPNSMSDVCCVYGSEIGCGA